MSRVLVLAAVAACSGKPGGRAPTLLDSVSRSDGNLVASMTAELQDDVLSSYERDEPPETETGMVPRDIGGARIGVGPGDVLIAEQLERAPSRWPLRLERATESEIRSKRLETHIAHDLSAAWVADELSWRLTMCGRTAVIPLRITMLYARDGDRWVQVFEHMSFGQTPTPRREGDLYGGRVPSKSVASSDFVDALSSAVSPVLSNSKTRGWLATGPEAMLLGPDTYAEWHGLDVRAAQLIPGGARTVEDRRIGYVGRDLESATIAYWIGNVVATLPARPGVPAGNARLRTTFVFERRRTVAHAITEDPEARDKAEADRQRLEATSCSEDEAGCRWFLVQGHVSQPIGDQDLATRVFGTALLSSNLEAGEALRLACF